MTDKKKHRHPIATRPPAPRPPRAEMKVRRGAYDEYRGEHWNHENDAVCDCYPRTSTHTIPSMFYDKIACPHTNFAHIQPAQETQFNYPWTADSVRGRERDDDELSERLSLLSQEDDQLRFSPNLHRNDPDSLSIQTAPPYWFKREGNVRDSKPPYTAPVNDMELLKNGPRAQSMQDIRNPAFRTDEMPGDREIETPNHRNSRLSNRQFTGTYVDPSKKLIY